MPSFFLSLVIMLASAWRGSVCMEPNSASVREVRRPACESITKLPSRSGFVANAGQWPIDARFVARTTAMLVRAAPSCLALQVFKHDQDARAGAVIDLRFVGSISGVELAGETELAGLRHYYIGPDPANWIRDVKSFARVRYRNLWPATDLVLYEGSEGIEYDVELGPGADLGQVRFQADGVKSISIDENGALVLLTEIGPMYQSRPHARQINPSGISEDVDCEFILFSSDSFGFRSLGRNPALPLVIDPTLFWSTYLGGGVGPPGNGEVINAMTVDDQRNLYLTGWTEAGDFPLTPGAYHYGHIHSGSRAMFVTKLSADGTTLLYSALFEGGGDTRGTGIAVDHEGRASVCGWTNGVFPTTPGAFDTVRSTAPFSTGVVFRLDATGSNVVYSTYLEGSGPCGSGQVDSIAVAPSGAVVVGGQTGCVSTFPTTPGSFMPTTPFSVAFLSRIDPTGSRLEWSTWFPASPTIPALVVDEFDEVTLTGQVGSFTFPITPGVFGTTLPSVNDASTFVTRMNASGSALVWSTYVSIGTPYAIRLTGDRGVVICGDTMSPDFRTTPGAFQQHLHVIPGSGGRDGFVCRISSDATQLIYSTLLGGIGFDGTYSLDSTPSGIATVTAAHVDSSYPVTPGAYSTVHQGQDEIGITRLDPTGSKLYYSTFLGGPGLDYPAGISISPKGRMLIVGETSGAFPVTAGAYDTTYNAGALDLFAAELDLCLVGVRPLGGSTPSSCQDGAVYLNATRMPRAGDDRFGFYCTGALMDAEGWLLLGNPSATSFDLDGVALWLDPTHAIARRRIHSNSLGFFELAYPLTSTAIGSSLACQVLLMNPPACAATSRYSTSNALVITVQP